MVLALSGCFRYGFHEDPDAAQGDAPVADVALHDVVHDVALHDVALHDVALHDVPVADFPVIDAGVPDAAPPDAPLPDSLLPDVAPADLPPPPPHHLELSGPTTVVAGACTAYSVTVKDAQDNDTPATTAITVSLSESGAGALHTDAKCQTTAATVVIAAGSSSHPLFHRDTKAEVVTIAVSDSAGVLAGASLSVAVQPGPAAATSSNITGTGPVVADGKATSSITITLGDAYGNAISGVVPTFTGSGQGNAYGACSPTSGPGLWSCTLASTSAGTKVLQIVTPVADTGGSVLFLPQYEIELQFNGNTPGGVLDRNGVDTGFKLVLPSSNAVCGDSSPVCDDPLFPYNPTALPYYIPGNILVDTANGTLALTTTDGDNVLGLNDQDNALVVPIDPSTPFELHVRIRPPTGNNLPDADYESGGVLWAKDQSNYLKLAFGFNCDNIASPCLGIQLGSEVGGSWNGGSTSTNPQLPPVPFVQYLDLILAGDRKDPANPNDNTATASYSVDGGPVQVIETRSVPDSMFANTGIHGGILATHTPYSPPDGGTPLTLTFDWFRLKRP